MTNTEKENYLITLEDGSVLDCHTLGTKCTKEQNQIINLYLVKIIRNRDKDKELAAEATEIFFKRNDALFTTVVKNKLDRCHMYNSNKRRNAIINFSDMKQEVLIKTLESFFYEGDDSKLESTILFYAIKATQSYLSKELVAHPMYQHLFVNSEIEKASNGTYCCSAYEFRTYIRPIKTYCNNNKIEVSQLSKNDIRNIAAEITIKSQRKSTYNNNRSITLNTAIDNINNILSDSPTNIGQYIGSNSLNGTTFNAIIENIGMADDKLNPEAITVENEKKELIHKAISHLTKEQQYIVYNYKLFGFGNASGKDIIESLGYMDKYSTIASAKETVSLEAAKIKKILAKELSDTLYSKEKACAS